MVTINLEQEQVELLVEVLFNEVGSMLSKQEPDQVRWLELLEELVREDMNSFASLLPVKKVGPDEKTVLVDIIAQVDALLFCDYIDHCEAEEDLCRVKHLLEMIYNLG